MALLSRYHGSLALSIKTFKNIHQKVKSTNFNMYPTPSKTHGDHPRKKRESKDGPFFWFATNCKCRATYDLNVKAIFLQLGEAAKAAS